MNTVGERVRREREAQGIERKAFAERIGMGYSTLAELERGGMQTTTKLRVIAEALGVSQKWLETGRGSKLPTADEPEDAEWANVVAFAQAVGLSEGAEADEYVKTHSLKFRRDSLTRKRLADKRLGVMYGKGDSMEPRIRDGDAVMFDTTDTRPRDGHIYVILVPGVGADSYSVKRCETIDDMVFFKAENPVGDHKWKKPRRMDDPRFPIKVIGRVRWIASWED